MIPELEITIRAEISCLKADHPQDWARRYFNNFYANFPTLDDVGMYREIAMEGYLDDETYTDSSLSQKKQSQTRKEYFATIDRTVQTLGETGRILPFAPALSAKILTEFNALSFTGFQELESYAEKETHRGTLHSMFCEIYLPVYISLREQGYSHTDLTA
ncbi:MAG: hypothetical protein ABIJ21_05120 [Nanoarchaeota archaeon]